MDAGLQNRQVPGKETAKCLRKRNFSRSITFCRICPCSLRGYRGGAGSGCSHCHESCSIKAGWESFPSLSREIKGAEARGEEGGNPLGCWAGSSSARRLFSVICAELVINVKRELECYRNPEIRGKISRCKHLKFLQ